MRAFILPFVFMASVFCLPADEVIREQVQVKWFVVPLAAMDGQDKCVTDLKPEEIEVYLEGRKVDPFRLVRLGYAVEKEHEGPAPETPAETLVAFLVFDNILTDANKLSRAKAMAIEMVKRAEGRQLFVVMSLEYVGGLKYLCGPSRQTGEVIAAIEKKVRVNRHRFMFYAHNDITIQSPYPADDESLLTPVEKERRRREQMRIKGEYAATVLNYLDSLRTLCLAMQTVSHKSVFLFSTGIKNGFFTSDTFKSSDETKSADANSIGSGIPGLLLMIRDLAERINQTGTFLVVLNPEGLSLSSADSDSGELMSHAMANSSGGEYLNTARQGMEEKALEMTRAFYEVQFADPGSGEKESLRVDVRSKRPGVSIHSLRHTSRSREYGDLTGIEKELLAVDAVESSYWARSILTIRRGRLPQPGISDKQAAYDLALPPQFRQKEVDIFFVQINEKKNDAKVTSQSLIPESDRHSCAVKPLKGYKQAFFIVCSSLHQGILLQ